MSLEAYKIAHLLGLTLVVLSLGGMLVHSINGGSKSTNSFRKGAMITHGIGLTLLLVAGFGLLAKIGIHGFPMWVVGKLLIWVLLAAGVALVYKQALAKKLWVVVPLLVVIASWLALMKP